MPQHHLPKPLSTEIEARSEKPGKTVKTEKYGFVDFAFQCVVDKMARFEKTDILADAIDEK